jgi:hypothetical protein
MEGQQKMAQIAVFTDGRASAGISIMRPGVAAKPRIVR